MAQTIGTPRLVLRPFRRADAPALHAICNQPHILRWMPDWQMNLEEVKGLIRLLRAQERPFYMGPFRAARALTLRESGAIAGLIGIGDSMHLDGQANLFYFLDAAHTSRGYTTEAAGAMSDWAMKKFGLQKLTAIAETGNEPSQRVLQGCGFVRQGTREIRLEGETRPRLYYTYLRAKTP